MVYLNPNRKLQVRVLYSAAVAGLVKLVNTAIPDPFDYLSILLSRAVRC
jgi:hypothetical protein